MAEGQSRRVGDFLFVIEAGFPGLKDAPVVRCNERRHGLPRKFRVGFSQELPQVLKAGVAEKMDIRPDVAKVPVLPEHAGRDGVQHAFQEPSRFDRFGFRRLQLSDDALEDQEEDRHTPGYLDDQRDEEG